MPRNKSPQTTSRGVKKAKTNPKEKSRNSQIPKFTLKQRKLVEAIPHSANLREAGIKAGYAIKSGSGQIYRDATRKHIIAYLNSQGFDKQGMINRFDGLSQLILKQRKPDWSNTNRSYENISKIIGLYADNAVSITPDNLTIQFIAGSTPPCNQGLPPIDTNTTQPNEIE
jgi:hypothetical protein